MLSVFTRNPRGTTTTMYNNGIPIICTNQNGSTTQIPWFTNHNLLWWRKQCSVCDWLWTLGLVLHTRPHPPSASTWTSPGTGSGATQQWLNRQPAVCRRVDDQWEEDTLYLILSSLYSHYKHELSSKHTTTQHTVNVVTHSPQRPAVDGSYMQILCTICFDWLLKYKCENSSQQEHQWNGHKYLPYYCHYFFVCL